VYVYKSRIHVLVDNVDELLNAYDVTEKSADDTNHLTSRLVRQRTTHVPACVYLFFCIVLHKAINMTTTTTTPQLLLLQQRQQQQQQQPQQQQQQQQQQTSYNYIVYD